MKMKESAYYLVTTKNMEDRLWFRNDEDFTVGMNHVAIQAFKAKVSILAFILMSNHLHFVLRGVKDDVVLFINKIKARFSQYLNQKYGDECFLRRNTVDYSKIPDQPDALEKAVAYVQMNCVAANICSHPSQYPWGTGDTFFSQNAHHGRKIGSLSHRARGRLLHSDFTDLPADWSVSDAGYIYPESYVDVKTVERLFIRAGRMNYFLNTSSKAKKRLEMSEDRHPVFRDQVIVTALPDLCWSLFGRMRFEELSFDEQVEFMRQIRLRFCSNVHQIARLCGLTYAEAARMLDRG